jgi:N-acetylglucosamine kinase-like BadF-type ATPase
VSRAGTLPSHPLRPAVLAVDGGNSKTDMALVGSDGTVLAEVRGPGVPIRLSAETLDLLGRLARSVAGQAGLPEGGVIATHMVACMANVDLPEEERELDEMLRAQGWSQTVDVANDTLAVLRAGLDGRLPAGLPGSPAAAAGQAVFSSPAAASPAEDSSPAAAGPAEDSSPAHWGVGITCGAGINGIGVAPDGRTTRYLALGTLTGDWGGGGSLAAAVMWWSARAEDGRGPRTMLREAVTAHFGVPEVRDVAIGIHLGKMAEESLLGLVPVLFQVAARGDQVATDLVHRQGDEVCTMVLAAIARLGLTGAAVPVVLGGSVLAARDPLLTERIAAGLAEGAPGSIMRIVSVPPIAGAALLGLDHVGAPASAQARLRSAYRSVSQPAQPTPGQQAGGR